MNADIPACVDGRQEISFHIPPDVVHLGIVLWFLLQITQFFWAVDVPKLGFFPSRCQNVFIDRMPSNACDLPHFKVALLGLELPYFFGVVFVFTNCFQMVSDVEYSQCGVLTPTSEIVPVLAPSQAKNVSCCGVSTPPQDSSLFSQKKVPFTLRSKLFLKNRPETSWCSGLFPLKQSAPFPGASRKWALHFHEPRPIFLALVFPRPKCLFFCLWTRQTTWSQCWKTYLVLRIFLTN